VAGSLPPLFGSSRPDLFDAAAAEPLLTRPVGALSPHVDLWLAETLSSTGEARNARRALGDDARPLWLSFTLHDGTLSERASDRRFAPPRPSTTPPGPLSISAPRRCCSIAAGPS
jgi:S-methylmethionine-dependent homocysteine/selenocysteine methylase